MADFTQEQLPPSTQKQTCAVYRIVNTENEKLYVGSSVDVKARWAKHIFLLSNGIHHSKHLQQAYNKYGPGAFSFEIVELLENPENMLGREQYWIDATGCCSRENGYNACPTASNMLGFRFSDKQKERCRQAQLGKTMSAEARRKISAANKGRQVSRTTREKISAANMGHVVTEETRKKLSLALSGSDNPNYGKQKSEETKKKMSFANSGERSYWFGKKQPEDMVKKRARATSGENNGLAKLTMEIVQEMRLLYKGERPISQRALAKMFGVTQANVWNILKNRTWYDPNYEVK